MFILKPGSGWGCTFTPVGHRDAPGSGWEYNSKATLSIPTSITAGCDIVLKSADSIWPSSWSSLIQPQTCSQNQAPPSQTIGQPQSHCCLQQPTGLQSELVIRPTYGAQFRTTTSEKEGRGSRWYGDKWQVISGLLVNPLFRDPAICTRPV